MSLECVISLLLGLFDFLLLDTHAPLLAAVVGVCLLGRYRLLV